MRRSWSSALQRRAASLTRVGVAGLSFVFAAACGGGGGEAQVTPPDMAVLPPDLILADLKDSDYPPGPYALSPPNPGDVLPDFTFQGYWSPNTTTGKSDTQPFGEVTFGMLHDSGAKYAILNLSAFW